MGIGSIIVFYLVPIVLVALVIRWVRLIKVNSDEQVQQNKQIITLLEDIRKRKNTL
ncbi:hypothetical protein RYX56_00605 [Alkalihalophilus lindianensis]|uniref:DUF4083 domain-containing protein n=1 Tax=Alkalihalophilus lindianensis TaxID=1630542 RepID=A0ABU3X4Q7_9BACI|nr:hypothetical protein [Alkalihalophilus lindianensis]MDV2682864.1 hypothetical protein [Alkalihalophilus lindianensis]